MGDLLLVQRGHKISLGLKAHPMVLHNNMETVYGDSRSLLSAITHQKGGALSDRSNSH